MANFPTYEFEGDTVVAKDDRVVIASGNDFAKVAASADEYFKALQAEKAAKARQSATHVVTPNGLRAEILGRTASVWEDEVTVRFENGQIRHLAVAHGEASGLQFVRESKAPDDSIQRLSAILDDPVINSKEGYLSRINDLEQLIFQAKTKIAKTKSYEDQQKLDNLILQASHEKSEIIEALEHLASTESEAYAMPKRAYEAVEQASLGRDDSWLEVLAREMVAESEERDLDALLKEGPVLLVSSVDDTAIDNAATVREIAFNEIINKTAGFTGEEIENYRLQFVAATEVARQHEARARKSSMAREASVKEAAVENATDESLFL